MALCWTFIQNQKSIKDFLIPLILGPYLLTSFLLQSGLFTDRSRALRETMEKVSSLDNIQNQIIKVDKSGLNNTQSYSKIIRISLMTPNLGESIANISYLNPSEIAWSTENEIMSTKSNYEIIYENKNLEPWKLIIKK